MPTSKSRAEYMAARRAAQKAAAQEFQDKTADLSEEQVTAKEIVQEVRRDTREHEDGDDRKNGLPRTNYYAPQSPAGSDRQDAWVRTIQRMNGHKIQQILDHPAIKTAKRG